MKKLNIILLLLACFAFSACMDDGYDTPTSSGRGNDSIKATNVVTISDLKNDYKQYIETDYRDGVSYTKIDKDIQIKGYITGNDITGNLYNEVSLQDETGAIIIAISEGGLCGYLPVGTEILVNLKGLYIGNYGLQAEIGTPFTSSKGGTYVSRMSRMLWNQHFTYTGNTKTMEPVEFDVATWNKNRTQYGGMLATLKNVKFKVSSDKETYANPGAGAGSKTIYFTGGSNTNSSVELYTSNYADFAAEKVPTGTVNVTGIVKRYNNYWEFIIRSLDDVQEVK